ncbi:hypothetical protein IAT38_002525 [Cryptococcus sp. DSM 104549]
MPDPRHNTTDTHPLDSPSNLISPNDKNQPINESPGSSNRSTYEDTLGLRIQLQSHCPVKYTPAEAIKYGMKGRILAPSDLRLSKTGPPCVKKEHCKECHSVVDGKRCLPTFIYQHPAVRCDRSADDGLPTLLFQWSEDSPPYHGTPLLKRTIRLGACWNCHTAQLESCSVDGQRLEEEDPLRAVRRVVSGDKRPATASEPEELAPAGQGSSLSLFHKRQRLVPDHSPRGIGLGRPGTMHNHGAFDSPSPAHRHPTYPYYSVYPPPPFMSMSPAHGMYGSPYVDHMAYGTPKDESHSSGGFAFGAVGPLSPSAKASPSGPRSTSDLRELHEQYTASTRFAEKSMRAMLDAVISERETQEEMRVQRDKAREELEALCSTRRKLDEEKDKMAGEVDTLRAEVDEAEKKVARLGMELDTAKKNLGIAQHAEELLEFDNGRLASELASAHAKVDEATAESEAKLASNRVLAGKLRRAEIALKNTQERITAASTKCDELRVELVRANATKGEWAAARLKLVEEIRNNEQELVAVKQKAREVEAERDRLAQEMEVARMARSPSPNRKPRFTVELAKTHAKLVSAEDTVVKLRAELCAARTELAESRKKAVDWQADGGGAAQKVERLTEEIKRSPMESRGFKQEADELKEKADAMRNRIEELEKANAGLESRCRVLSQQVENDKQQRKKA